MKKSKFLFFLLLIFSILLLDVSCKKKSNVVKLNEETKERIYDDMVLVEGDYNDYWEKGTKSFYISKYEVTQSLYELITGNNPNSNKGENLPVTSITWYDAIEFCNKLSDAMGLEKCYTIEKDKVSFDLSKDGFRLPTYNEWNYALGSIKTDLIFIRDNEENNIKIYWYNGKDGININEVAWYKRNSEDKTHPVGQLEANKLGLYDMLGNVWEYCNDGLKHQSTKKFIRGGSFTDREDVVFSLDRYDTVLPSGGGRNVGFRLVRSFIEK